MLKITNTFYDVIQVMSVSTATVLQQEPYQLFYELTKGTVQIQVSTAHMTRTYTYRTYYSSTSVPQHMLPYSGKKLFD